MFKLLGTRKHIKMCDSSLVCIGPAARKKEKKHMRGGIYPKRLEKEKKKEHH